MPATYAFIRVTAHCGEEYGKNNDLRKFILVNQLVETGLKKLLVNPLLPSS